MSGFVLLDDGSDRSRWLERRRGGVSATDAGKIIPGGPQGWASLRHAKLHGESFAGSTATRYGKEREPYIAAFAEAEFGIRPSTALVERADAPGDLATPDALGPATIAGFGLTEDGPLAPGIEYTVEEFGEFKTTNKRWEAWADVPKAYRWQVTWQFLVTGADRCFFVFEPHTGYKPDGDMCVFVIERDEVEKDFEYALERVAAWRESDPDDVPEHLAPLDDLITERVRVAADLADLDERIRAITDEHDGEMTFEGSAGNLRLGRPGTRSSFDAKAFRERYPATHARFVTSSPTRPRLTITARS